MKSKVVILTELNKPLIVDDVEIPILQCGQVLVEIYKSGICGAQIGEITGAKGEDRFLPHLMGHEGAGIVLEVGEGVKHVKEGDHVVAHWRKGLGIEAPFPKYKWRKKTVGGGNVTTFCERAIISENRLTVVKKEVPFTIGALMGCAVTTGLGLINNEAKLKIGESIMVIGCGGVGLNVIQGAKLVSGNPIIGVDITSRKLLDAWEFGATHVINTTVENFEEAVKKITGSNKVDVVVDCSGVPEMVNKGWGVTKSRMILVGQPHHTQQFVFKSARDLFYNNKQIFDSQGGLTSPNIDIPKYLDLYLEGKIELNDIVTHNFKLEEVNEAIELIKSGNCKRCILDTK
jgi:S-(hydroxymethyl)glutathione dehydrogenase/alcohol dehydrogenase